MLQTHQAEILTPAEVAMPKSIRALLLDDSNFDRARIRRLSQKTNLIIQLDEVNSIDEMDSAVAQSNYDLILIDYRLPVGDGMVALDHILKNPLNKDAGKIMITGNVAVDTAVTAMRGGCHDFLNKDEISAETLRDAMVNAMSLANAQRHLAMQVEQQGEIIRQGLLNALADEEVTGTVINLVHQQMMKTQRLSSPAAPGFQSAEIDALLASFDGDDDFVFH